MQFVEEQALNRPEPAICLTNAGRNYFLQKGGFRLPRRTIFLPARRALYDASGRGRRC